MNTLINLYQSGQMAQAEQACSELLQTYPQSLTVLNVLGAVLAGQGQLPQAISSSWIMSRLTTTVAMH